MTKPAAKRPLVADLAVGLLAGLVATHVTNFAQRPLKRMTPTSVRRQEERVRPGATSSLVAARSLAQVLGARPCTARDEFCGQAIHFGVGMGWGPVYGLLRRYAGLRSVGAALTTGTAMALILDETLVPALGFSAPARRYRAFTHVRGLVAHLVYGAAVALAAEGLARVANGRTVAPPRPRGSGAARPGSSPSGDHSGQYQGTDPLPRMR